MVSLREILPERVSSKLTPRRRDGLVFAIGLVLLLSPALVTMGYVGGTSYHYESTEVVTADNSVVYVDESEVPDGTPISERIACAGTQVERVCALEPVLEDEILPLGVESDNPDRDPVIQSPSYEYVQLDDELRRAVYTTTGDGEVGVALNETSAGVALQSVSLNPEEESISSTVVEAAEDGEATSRSAVDVPQTPVIVDGDYYRVYLVEEAGEGSTSPLSLGIFFGAGLGGILLLSLARNLRVKYTPR